jgi:hypothetical protein
MKIKFSVLDVPCNECGAKEGQRCTTQDGNRKFRSHIRRLNLAKLEFSRILYEAKHADQR